MNKTIIRSLHLTKSIHQRSYYQLARVLSGPSKYNLPNKCGVRNACSFSGSNGTHNKNWIYERIATLALIGIIPAAIVFPSSILDYTIIPLISYHHYVGCESIINDYARPIIFGKTFVKIINYSNIIITFAMAIGLTMFVYNDIGIGNAVKKFWTINHKSIN